jgi:hypothetical protein
MKTFSVLLASSLWSLFSGGGEYGEYVDNVTGYELSGVLQGGGFSADQDCKVEHSYYSATPPPNNDCFKAYVIHLASFPNLLLVTNQPDIPRWESGLDTNELHLKVLSAAQTQTTSTTNVWWLPPLAEFSSTNYYRCFVYINTNYGEPNPVSFYAYDRQKQKLYYIGYKH